MSAPVLDHSANVQEFSQDPLVSNSGVPVETTTAPTLVAPGPGPTATGDVPAGTAETSTVPTSTVPATATATEPVVSSSRPATTEGAGTTTHAAATHDGILGYKAPGLLSKIRYSKKYFWLGDEAVHPSGLKEYLDSEKSDVGHHNAAWSSQTGKGLLYFAKRQEDKATPAGLICLADITEVDKGPEKNEFSFKIHSKTHEFQAKDESERDSWHAALESSMYHAKGIKEDLVSSGPYKDNHAAIAKGGAALDKKENSKSKDRGDSRRRSGVFGAKKDNDKEVKAANESAERERKEQLAADKKASELEAEKKNSELAAGGVGAAGLVGAGAIAASHHDKDAPVKEAAVADKTTSPTTADEAHPKSKRTSMFGLFNRNKSPSPSKTSETTPVVPTSNASATDPVEPAAMTSTGGVIPMAAAGQSSTTTEPASTGASKGGISTFKGLGAAEPTATAPTSADKPEETVRTGDSALSAFANDPVSAPTTSSVPASSSIPATTATEPTALTTDRSIAGAAPSNEITTASSGIATTGTPMGAIGTIEPGKADYSQIVNAVEGQSSDGAVTTLHGPTGANPFEGADAPALHHDGPAVRPSAGGQSGSSRRMSSFLGFGKKDKATETDTTAAPVATSSPTNGTTTAAKSTTDSPVETTSTPVTAEKKEGFFAKLGRRSSKMYKKEPSPSPAARTAAPIAETAPTSSTVAPSEGVTSTGTTAEPGKVASTTDTVPTTNGSAGQQSIGDVVPEAVSRGEPSATNSAM